MLTQQAENLWTVESEQPLGFGMRLPIRMTVVRLPDSSLTLISPVPIDEPVAQSLATLGPVGTLIAPNRLHHLHIAAATQRYPDARVLGADGVAAKQPSVKFAPIALKDSAHCGVLESAFIEGAPKISENVFWHCPSKTLIVTELVFNVQVPPNFLTGALLWSTGTRGRLAQSRVWSFMTEDISRARSSTARLFEWEFDRLIMAHGDVVQTGARELLGPALTRTGPGASLAAISAPTS